MKKPTSRDTRDLRFEKPLPSNIEAERSILGAILLDNETISQAQEKLAKEDFFLDSHRRIYQAMLDLRTMRRAIDPITLQDALRQAGDLDSIGGAAFIGALIDGVPRFSNIREYCAIVKEKATLRSLIVAAQQTINRCYDGEESAAILSGESRNAFEEIESNFRQSQGRSYKWLHEGLEQAVDDLRALQNPPTDGRKLRFATGFRCIDSVLGGGFSSSDYVLLAARTYKGKSMLLKDFALNGFRVDKNIVGAYFNLEMDTRQVGHRILFSESGIAHEYYKRATFNQEETETIHAVLERYEKAKIALYDQSSLTPRELLLLAQALKKQEGRLDWVFLDYLRLLKPNEKQRSRYERIAENSEDLKRVQRELKCPLFTPVQIKPSADDLDRPLVLTDIAEGDVLVQDADIVILFQPGARDGDYIQYKLDFAKARNDPQFTATLYFNLRRGRFEERSQVKGWKHPDSNEE